MTQVFYFLSHTVMRVFALCLSVLLLSGCGALFGDDGYFPDRSSDYLQAKEAAPLVVPDDKSTDALVDAYHIPDLKYAKVLPDKYHVPRVEPLDNVENKGSVRIQNFQEDRWILIRRSPGQTWPILVNFLASNQIPVYRTAADQGLLETDWLTVSEDAEFSAASQRPANQPGPLISKKTAPRHYPKERYQFVVKAGVQKNSAEVWVRQLAIDDTARVESIAQTKGEWSHSSSGKRQQNMMQLLAEHLAGSPDQSSHSLLAQGIGSASKVALEYDTGGVPYLDLQLPFARGWASLGLALEKASFQVSDLDRSQGIYFAEFVERNKKKKKPGVIRRLSGALLRKRQQEEASEKLLVTAKQQGESLYITIQRDAETELAANEQAFLLRKILNKLS